MDDGQQFPTSQSESGASPDGEANGNEAESRDVGSVEAELRAFLQADESRLGDVFRGLQEGLTADEIAERHGIETSNFVWNYHRIVDAVLERDLPTAPTVALNVARKFRTLLKADWSTEVRARLEEDRDKLERLAADSEAVAEETQAALSKTADVEDEAPTGIYVYALPHYLRFPFDPESGRTLLKVGRSDRDVIKRFRDQTRTTALPEEPVLLRVYPTDLDGSLQSERAFHETLRAFDHGRDAERMAGKEWFLTTTRAVDQVARILGLEIEVVNDVASLD